MEVTPVTGFELLRLLWRRKLLLTCAAVISGGAALVAAKAVPPHYTGEALLLVGKRDLPIPEISAEPPGELSLSTTGVRTELDILRSRALIAEVVRDLDLVNYPALESPGVLSRFAVLPRAYLASLLRWLGVQGPSVAPPETAEARAAQIAGSLQREIALVAEEQSRIIAVRWRSSSPVLAAAVPNTLVEHYIANETAARRDMTLQAHQWLTERLTKLRQDVEDADRKVQEFRDRNRLLQVQAGSLATIQLNEAQGQLSTATQDLARKQVALSTVTADTTGGVSSAQEVLASPLIQRLRDRESEVSERLSSISHQFGTQHPSYGAAAAELQEVRRAIATETGKVVDTLQRDVDVARGRVNDLEQRVSALQEAARQGADAEVILAQLQREADGKRAIFQAFLGRAAQTGMPDAQFPAARVVSPAVRPTLPDGPRPSLMAVFGALGGVTLAAAFCLLGELLRTGVRSARELSSLTGMPSVGSIPALRRPARSRSRLLGSAAGQSAVAETLSAMRISIQTLAPAPTVVLVTSSDIGEGKTTLARSLATLSAADGLRVLLVETDLRRPTLAAMLDSPPQSRLETVLAGKAALKDAVHVDRTCGLHSLLAAGSAERPQRQLQAPEFDALLSQARSDYQFIILDSPPVLRVADPLLLARRCDVTLFVVRWNRTSRAHVAEAIRRFPSECRPNIVTVLNQVHPGSLSPEERYGGYGDSSTLTLLRGFRGERRLTADAIAEDPGGPA